MKVLGNTVGLANETRQEELKMRQGMTPDNERKETLEQLEDWIETPMTVLGFVWLVLLVVELTRGLPPALEVLTSIIWACFVLEFTLKFALAPEKVRFLRRNWPAALSLLAPALRLLRVARAGRIFRMGRFVRELRLVKVIGSLNRSISTLRTNFRHFGAGYVALMSVVVTLVGAAGMYAFEHDLSGGDGLRSYGDALWWTAMIMTTLGSQYWPVTVEGRILGFLLSLYAFGVFGYVAGALAGYFIGRGGTGESAAGRDAETVDALRREIRSLRDEMREARSRIEKPHGGGAPGCTCKESHESAWTDGCPIESTSCIDEKNP